MEDCETVMPPFDGEQHVIAAAQHILKVLAASKNVSSDVRKILADLDVHLSTMNRLTEADAGGTSEAEDRLKCAQEKVLSWQSNQVMIWDSGPQEASEYLQAVDEVRRLTENLGCLLSNRNEKQKELLDRAHSVLQEAMTRLEEELIHILSHNKQSFRRDSVSVHSCDGDVVYESIASSEDCSVGDISRRVSIGTEPEEYLVDLVNPQVISDIKSIANVMFASNYDQEFCQSFIRYWREATDDYLAALDVDRHSIDDLLRMEWNYLTCRIKKWCRAMKKVIRFYLTSKKQLFGQVLGEFGSASTACFVEASKPAMLCLLNFGQAITIGLPQPEKLSSLLDMYEVLTELLQDVDALFSEEVGALVRSEFHELLQRLGDSARLTFAEFESQIASDISIIPFPKGGIHHLTKYVMNYVTLLSAAYCDTLNLLFGDQDGEDLDAVIEEDGHQSTFSCVLQPAAHCLRSLTSRLEANLEKKSNLYRDASLKHVFMMNNIHYMVQKVKDTEVEAYFGDEWIREHMVKLQLHAKEYGRATWSSSLLLLRDDGNTAKAILKERCRSFTNAFDDVYKNQTGWFVPDLKLRDDLRISTSQQVIPAYRGYLARATKLIGDKNIKYTVDDLEKYILDLFEGSSMSLPNPRRR